MEDNEKLFEEDITFAEFREHWDAFDPCISRPKNGHMSVRLGDTRDIRMWRQKALIRQFIGKTTFPRWNSSVTGGCWEIARHHLHPLAEAMAHHFGEAHLLLRFNRSMKCDTRCRTARGDDCVCSCAYVYHGFDDGSGFLVGDTTIIVPMKAGQRALTVSKEEKLWNRLRNVTPASTATPANEETPDEVHVIGGSNDEDEEGK